MFSPHLFQSSKGLLLLFLAGLFTMVLTLVILAFLFPEVYTLLIHLSDHIVAWDAGWYRSIVENDYVFIPDQQCNPAFFPLLPWLWKALNGNALLVSLMNITLSIISLLIFKTQFEIKSNWGLLLLFLFPSFLFMHIPYSEALFFLGSTFILIALLKEKWGIGIIGFLITGFARPAGMIFIPAVALLYLVELYSNKNEWEKKTLQFIIYLSSNLLALFSVLYIQYYQTDVWNAYGKAVQGWNFGLEFPSFPFDTMKVGDVYYITFALDTMAYGVALIALVFLIRTLLQIFQKKTSGKIDYPFLFSCSYIFLAVFFRLISQNGSLLSTNRYLFCTPFVFLLLQKLYIKIKNQEIKVRDFFIWFLVVFFSVAINFAEATAVLIPTFVLIGLAFFLIKNQSIYMERYWILLCLLFAVLHCLAFIGYMSKQWVG